MNIVCSGCNFSNPYTCFSRFVGYYNVNVKLAGTGSLYTDKSRIRSIRRREDFYKMENYEDKIYSLGETVTGQTQAMSQAVQKTLENNGGVGIMTGSYDQNLSILSVNNLLLHSTGYTFDTFMEQTKGSLRNFFYDEEDILERDRFLQLHGTGEAQILAADGTVKNVRLCKEDATDEAGRQIWVMSVQVNWDHVNLTLLNEAICSGFWYFDCDENSEIVNANWSHEFRKMLGYHDTLDFPNKLESWSDLLHPQDKERVMVQLQAAIAPEHEVVLRGSRLPVAMAESLSHRLGDDAKNHSVFSKILQAAEAGDQTFPFTTGKSQYDFIDVDELADQIACAVSQNEILGIINCCTGRPVSLAEKAERFIAERGLNIRLAYGAYPDRPYDSPVVYGDPSKIRKIMGIINH